MSSINKHIIVGNIGTHPKIMFSQNGVKRATFRVITNYNRKQNGEWVEDSDGHNVVAWDHLADLVDKYLEIGQKVYIEGPNRTRKYNKDGEERTISEVVARELVICSPFNRKQTSTADEGEETGGDVPF